MQFLIEKKVLTFNCLIAVCYNWEVVLISYKQVFDDYEDCEKIKVELSDILDNEIILNYYEDFNSSFPKITGIYDCDIEIEFYGEEGECRFSVKNINQRSIGIKKNEK